jgi:hypothetical protein
MMRLLRLFFVVVVLLLLSWDSGCSHAYTCSKGMSAGAATTCCSVYCGDKKMEPNGSLELPGEDAFRCVCRQPYHDPVNHKGKGPSGLF